MSNSSNRLAEYFLVVGVDSKSNDSGGSASVVSPPTSPLSAITEEDSKRGRGRERERGGGGRERERERE